MKFNERLKKLRTERHLKQVDVARAAGINPDVYHSWESGRREPHISALPKLAMVFNTDYNGLLGGYRSITDVEKEIASLREEWNEELRRIKEDLNESV